MKAAMSEPVTNESVESQRSRVRDGIADKRGGVVSPLFEALLECPPIADAASNMGASIRFEGTLPAALREVAICTVAAHWRVEYEWNAHAHLALQAGVSQDALDAILARKPLPPGELVQQAVHAFMAGLLQEGRANAAHRQQIVDLLGQTQAVELVAIAGYFSLASFVLNTFA